MKKVIIFLIFPIFLTASGVLAETIYLKNGNKIEGKIVQQTDTMVKVDISGVTITYYADEIDRIEGLIKEEAPASQAGGAQPADQFGGVIESPTSPISMTSPMSSTQGPRNLAEIASGSKPPSRELVLRYLDASGTSSNMDDLFQKMVEKSDPKDRPRLQQAYDIEEIMEILVPIYQKHFTERDLKKLIAFYSSPVAQKLAKVTPSLMKDTLEASVKYFQAKLPPKDTP